jgi:hypothetical protein
MNAFLLLELGSAFVGPLRDPWLASPVLHVNYFSELCVAQWEIEVSTKVLQVAHMLLMRGGLQYRLQTNDATGQALGQSGQGQRCQGT